MDEGSKRVTKHTNLPEINIRNTLQDISIGKDFSEKTPTSQAFKTKINKRHHIKLTSFCTEIKLGDN